MRFFTREAVGLVALSRPPLRCLSLSVLLIVRHLLVVFTSCATLYQRSCQALMIVFNRHTEFVDVGPAGGGPLFGNMSKMFMVYIHNIILSKFLAVIAVLWHKLFGKSVTTSERLDLPKCWVIDAG